MELQTCHKSVPSVLTSASTLPVSQHSAFMGSEKRWTKLSTLCSVTRQDPCLSQKESAPNPSGIKTPVYTSSVLPFLPRGRQAA